MAYGSVGYKFSMQTSGSQEPAAKGRNAPPVPTNSGAKTKKYVRSAFMGMMMDEQIMGLWPQVRTRI
jgi:hypothetical protein